MRPTHRTIVVAAVIALACLASAAAVLVVARVQAAPQRVAGDQAEGSTIANAAIGQSTALQDRNDVVTFSGVGDVHFGDSMSTLERQGFREDPSACTRTVGDLPGVDPVMADGRLVLMWVNPPVHTLDGISVGSSVSAVRSAYTGEQDLASGQAYPAILVQSQDKAFLFLHDGKTVKKVIAGYADYVRRLYTEGFGAC